MGRGHSPPPPPGLDTQKKLCPDTVKYHLYKNLFRLSENIQVLIRWSLLYFIRCYLLKKTKLCFADSPSEVSYHYDPSYRPYESSQYHSASDAYYPIYYSPTKNQWVYIPYYPLYPHPSWKHSVSESCFSAPYRPDKEGINTESPGSQDVNKEYHWFPEESNEVQRNQQVGKVSDYLLLINILLNLKSNFRLNELSVYFDITLK